MLRTVVDTNILVSALLKSRNARFILNAFIDNKITLLFSKASLDELFSTIRKPHLSKYITPHEVALLAETIRLRGKLVHPTASISDCRDPKDNFVLEIAVNGHANIIVTGDDDLLVLNPYHGIRIVKPADFIKILNK